MSQEKRFLSCADIIEITGLSKSKTYSLIRELNEELEKKGFLTVRGKVISPYFYERFFGKDDKKMPVYKDKNGNWFVKLRYTDWTGKTKQTTKRGFNKQKDAKQYERDFLVKKQHDLTKTFKNFYEIYFNYISKRIKYNTLLIKKIIFESKILRYFGDKRMCDIKPSDIIAWQNIIMEEKSKNDDKHSQAYLKTIHNQLSAIFNFAVKFYDLNKNPARQAGNMGKEETKEMQFWTKEEYLKFSQAIMDKEDVYHAFQILYWCGLRLGELLALTKEDFDLENSTLRINKSYNELTNKILLLILKLKKVIAMFICLSY